MVLTIDPKLVERNLPAFLPFVLFPKQREWIDWVAARVNMHCGQQPMCSPKDRGKAFVKDLQGKSSVASNVKSPVALKDIIVLKQQAAQSVKARPRLKPGRKG